MHATLTLRDYRCFTRAQPAVFEIGPGFTAFIGANNTGKSTLLRVFYELRAPLQQLGNLVSPGMAAGMITGNPFGSSSFPPPITDPAEVVCEREGAQLEIELRLPAPAGPTTTYIELVTLRYDPDAQNWRLELAMSGGTPITQTNFVTSSATFIQTQSGDQLQLAPLLELIAALTSVQYLGPFRNAVNEGAGSYFDLQLGSGFVDQWHSWKTGPLKSQNRAIARVTEDVKRLMGVKSLEINASPQLKTLNVSVDGRPHKLSELGAGIAQLIVVLGNALIRRPSFIAIDEPETHLHPALQLDFLTTLASYARNGVLYATHSMGLARSTADRLYSVQQSPQGSIVREYHRTPHFAEFLGSMGIAGLQELGWDKILLVEGPTEVRTFQQFLRRYGKDRSVVLLSLGGSSLINGKSGEHLSEVVRLGGKVAAVIDSERSAADREVEKPRREFAEICAQLGIECHVLQRRATENYLSDRALKAAFGPSVSEPSHYDKPEPNWGKTQNWLAARELSLDELNSTDLGPFLERL